MAGNLAGGWDRPRSSWGFRGAECRQTELQEPRAPLPSPAFLPQGPRGILGPKGDKVGEGCCPSWGLRLLGGPWGSPHPWAVLHCPRLQGEPCQPCPALPTGMLSTAGLPGKPGPRGEPGTPGRDGVSVSRAVSLWEGMRGVLISAALNTAFPSLHLQDRPGPVGPKGDRVGDAGLSVPGWDGAEHQLLSFLPREIPASMGSKGRR